MNPKSSYTHWPTFLRAKEYWKKVGRDEALREIERQLAHERDITKAWIDAIKYMLVVVALAAIFVELTRI